MKMRNHSLTRFPSSGPIEGLFDRLAAYICQVDPTWKERTSGVSNEEITRFIALSGLESAGFECPKSYRIYLRHMGKDDGQLIEPPLIFRTFDWATDFYTELRDVYLASPDPEMLTVASFATGAQLSFDLRQPTEAEPNLYVTADGEFFELYSESWEKLLFQYAVLKYERYRFRLNLSFCSTSESLRAAALGRVAQNRLEFLSRFSLDEGLTPAWFNDRVHYCAFRDDMSIWLDFISGNNVSMLICGSEEKDVRRAGERISNALSLRLTLPDIKR